MWSLCAEGERKKPKTRELAADDDIGRCIVEDDLLDTVTDGTIKFISGRWLVDADLKKMKRCQDLPETAFVSPDKVVDLYNEHEDLDGDTRAVLSMSYPWLSADHPDPNGHHLKTVKAFVKALFEDNEGLEDVAIFWDFASLPQKPFGSDKEKQIFKSGLKKINYVYGASNTEVLRLTHIPADAENNRAYMDRGWCYFETAVASLRKEEDNQIVELEELSKMVNGDDESYFAKAKKALKTYFTNMDPVAPDEFDIAIGKRAFTNGLEDKNLVKRLYRDWWNKIHDDGGDSSSATEDEGESD